MTIALIILALMVAYFLVVKGAYHVTSHKAGSPNKKDKTNQYRHLSNISRYLMKENNSLPPIHQNDNLETVLNALDIKTGNNSNKDGRYVGDIDIDELRDTGFNWGYPACREYLPIRDAIDNLKGSLEKQKKALEIANIQTDLDELSSIVSHYRSEGNIVRQVTDDLNKRKS